MPELTPREWFGQFEPNAQMSSHAQWCGRHWAPCPVLHYNGIGAATELMQVFIDELGDGATTADELNARLADVGRVCCALGDERMYEIWGHWPPAAPAEVTQ
jgi:hypothetical protein